MQKVGDNFNRDFKDQLSQKVLTRIERRYNRERQLSEAELKSIKGAERANQQAQFEKLMTGSMIGTCGFIVAKLPLMFTKSTEQMALMNYQKRQQFVNLGRLAKVCTYGVLAFAYYMRHISIEREASDCQFRSCVNQPILDGTDTQSPCFYNRSQIEAMYRSFLLKSNKLNKENEALKKYKYDPQSYH